MRAALIAATATGLATGLGAAPFLFVRELPRRVYDGVLGLGAGLMLAAATPGSSVRRWQAFAVRAASSPGAWGRSPSASRSEPASPP